MKIYWEVYFEKVSTKDMLRQLYNPVREYEDSLIDGAVIDIGCGQTSFLLDYTHANRELIAIDNEPLQLDWLRKRIEAEKLELNKWKFYNQSFPQTRLPSETYALMFLSNLLHFYSLPECIKIGELLSEHSVPGTLCYISVHSDAHYTNNPADLKNNDYFKHYFCLADLENVFVSDKFELIYCASIEKFDSKAESEITNEWLDRILKSKGITNPIAIAAHKHEYLKNRSQSDLHAIFRRR